MKRKYILLLPLVLLMSSCVIKDNGDLGFASWVIYAVVGFVIFFIILIISSSKEEKKTKENLSKQGLSLSSFKEVGMYVGGHPKYSRDVGSVSVKDEKAKVSFYKRETPISMPQHIFDISKSSIKAITVEDSSSIEKKITLGRVVLVGIFALAWRKKKKNEVAFLVIEWNDGRFDHATTFVFETKNAMQKSNAARNRLIAIIHPE